MNLDAPQERRRGPLGPSECLAELAGSMDGYNLVRLFHQFRECVLKYTLKRRCGRREHAVALQAFKELAGINVYAVPKGLVPKVDADWKNSNTKFRSELWIQIGGTISDDFYLRHGWNENKES